MWNFEPLDSNLTYPTASAPIFLKCGAETENLIKICSMISNYGMVKVATYYNVICRDSISRVDNLGRI